MTDPAPAAMTAAERYIAFRRSLPPRPPITKQLVRLRGLELAVFTTPRVEGATPLVCVNGGLLFDHSLLWPALAPLAQRRQLVFYDQRGRGKSSMPPGVRAARIEHDAGDLVALRTALEIPLWDVLGHSYGGGIAMLAASDDIAGVRRLVLVSAVGITSEWLPSLHSAGVAHLSGAPRERLEAFDVSRLNEPDIAFHAEYSRAFFPAYFADQSFAASVVPPVGSSITGAVIAARLRREGYDWRERIGALRAPTLVLHGADDVLPAREAQRTASALHDARLIVLPNAGHNPFWETPVAFFAAIEEFLGGQTTDR